MMGLWRFLIAPANKTSDTAGRQIREMLAEFSIGGISSVHSARIFLIELAEAVSDHAAIAQRIADELLTDSVVETCRITRQGQTPPTSSDTLEVEVFFKPGVMDPVANSTLLALKDMGIDVTDVRTARRYEIQPIPSDMDLPRIKQLVGNACIEDVVFGAAEIVPPAQPPHYVFETRRIPIRKLNREDLRILSRQGHLFLSTEEMLAIQTHFRQADREPTDLELETLAQTWSEHCVHKTLKSAVTYRGQGFARFRSEDAKQQTNGTSAGGDPNFTIHYENLLKETIGRATQELIREGRGPQCLSVFEDNAGIIGFDEQFGLAFKVETHNHPSAIEPYGGAATGMGGVIRDILGCGLGARPVAATDVFCVAPPDWPVDRVPKGVIHPKTVLKGIVAGVRDYGNRMGIPTVSGAVHFDPRFLGNPLVYCGCVGLIPRDRITKDARPGDAVVLLGGRTGRDGIHGATFSSAELTETHETEFSHAVQIGNPIEEKKVLDIILQARDYHDSQAPSAADTKEMNLRMVAKSRGMDAKSRGLQPARPLDTGEESRSRDSHPHKRPGKSQNETDEPQGRNEEPQAPRKARAVVRPAYKPSYTSISPHAGSRCLFSAITDCGAGGLSSAIGEMGAGIGVEVDLENVPLKYSGLRYDEIWISESQERMVLAVPLENVETLLALAKREDVEATVIGRFTDTGRLIVRYEGQTVGDLDMKFLHDGLPKRERIAEWSATAVDPTPEEPPLKDPIAELKHRLGNHNTASKHWIIRQYDHEVQGGSVIKPLVGRNDGPSDAAVIRPRLDSRRGFALGCGMAMCCDGDDPYWMAIVAIDEAVRNVVCVGGDPGKTAILDNFCWPSADDPHSMGSLVRMCQACYDASKAYGIPFISGKDSLNNVFSLNPTDATMMQDVLHNRYPRVWAQRQASQRRHPNKLAIPNTLLISAIAIVEDVDRCIRSVPILIQDQARLFLVTSNHVDEADPHLGIAAKVHSTVAKLIQDGLIAAAHDCSEGGLATTVAEMAIASGLDTELLISRDEAFSESSGLLGGYVVQAIDPELLARINEMPGLATREIALMQAVEHEPTFRFAGDDFMSHRPADPPHVALSELIVAWKTPLDW